MQGLSLHRPLPLTPHVRARCGIAGADGVVAPEQALVVCPVRAGEGHQRPRCPVPATAYLDLAAADVDLCTARTLRLVQGNGLGAHQVLPVGNILGNGEGDDLFLCRRKGERSPGLEMKHVLTLWYGGLR